MRPHTPLVRTVCGDRSSRILHSCSAAHAYPYNESVSMEGVDRIAQIAWARYEGTVRAPVADPVARCIAALFGHRQNLRDEREPPLLEAEPKEHEQQEEQARWDEYRKEAAVARDGRRNNRGITLTSASPSTGQLRTPGDPRGVAPHAGRAARRAILQDERQSRLPVGSPATT